MLFLLKYWKFIAGGLIILSLVSSIILFKQHYDTLKKERDDYLLKFNTAEQNHKTTKASFNQYKVDAERNIENLSISLDNLAGQFEMAVEKSNELEKMLSKHDFGYLAKKKPGLINNRVNSATDRLFRTLEQETRTNGSDSN